MFDDAGPLSVQTTLQMIRKVEYESPVVIVGPLHICDCWSESSKGVLWRHLSAFSAGPGIIVVDVPREKHVHGLFQHAGRLTSLDAYFMKSRLSKTEGGFA